MLNLKKALTEIAGIIGVDYLQVRGGHINEVISIPQRAYARIALIVPDYFTMNSFGYSTYCRKIAAGIRKCCLRKGICDPKHKAWNFRNNDWNYYWCFYAKHNCQDYLWNRFGRLGDFS